MVGIDKRATVTDWPVLKRLIPGSFQCPPIEQAKEKQKQSQNPTTKAPMYMAGRTLCSKPMYMTPTMIRKRSPFAVYADKMLLIFFENRATVNPPTNYPQPSIIKVTKVK